MSKVYLVGVDRRAVPHSVEQLLTHCSLIGVLYINKPTIQWNSSLNPCEASSCCIIVLYGTHQSQEALKLVKIREETLKIAQDSISI